MYFIFPFVFSEAASSTGKKLSAEDLYLENEMTPKWHQPISLHTVKMNKSWAFLCYFMHGELTNCKWNSSQPIRC